MGIFSQYKTEGLEQSQDRLGGFTPLESNIYIATISAVYAQPAKSGAMGVTLEAKLDNDRDYSETFYVSDREGKNYFLNKQDSSKKVPLPGFTTVNDICLIVSETPLCDQETEEKVIKVYDAEAKKELPKSVPMITGLIGKKVALAIANELHNKSVRKDDGSYADTAETRNVNAVVKVFHPEYKLTVYEATEGKEATFWDKWLERYKGQVIDRRKIKEGEGTEGRPPKAAPQANKAPRASLFGKR